MKAWILAVALMAPAAMAEQLSADKVLLMTCMRMEKSILVEQRIPMPSEQECLLVRHAKGVPDSAEPKIGVAKPAPVVKSAQQIEADRITLGCVRQSNGYAWIVSARQEGWTLEQTKAGIGRQLADASLYDMPHRVWADRITDHVFADDRTFLTTPHDAAAAYYGLCLRSPTEYLVK
ncbi:hypothetical protein A9C11_22990 [Pseudomonas citronellolis]|uniref:Uncharacterized protein n=1 Tax=Pseudomonas citronellolis TaxID=53408 RepID=A0A1A9KFR9_9PSED|nr:hypothetical protein [Pseudomonas citronellolis]ANI16656.1 hypothetical protein A9C11_22990 [Pseudomonas citronellolis]